MDSLEKGSLEYKTNTSDISKNDVSDPFVLYHDTKDPELREILFYKYMNYVKKKMLKFSNGVIDEDLIQIGYEVLVTCSHHL